MAQTTVRKEQIKSITTSQISDYSPVTVTDSADIDFTLTGQNITGSLKTTGVAANTYKSATITVDSKGRITSAGDGAPSAKGIVESLVTNGFFWITECIENRDFLQSLTNVSITELSGETNHPGIIRFSSTTAAIGNSGSLITLRQSGGSEATILLQGGEKAVAVLRTGSVTVQRIEVGFKDSTDTDACYIYMAGGGQVYGFTSNNASTTTSSSIVTLSSNTWYRLEVGLNSNASIATFSVYDSVGVLLGSTTIDRDIPTGSGRNVTGYFRIATATAHSGTLSDLDYLGIATGILVR